MNIFFAYNKGEYKFENKVNNIREYIEKNKDIYKIKVLSKITIKSKCDLYIIVSDDLEEIHRCSVKFEDKNRILVITSNIKSSHVLGCINVTSNLTYLGNDNKIILKRINDIYEKNKKS